jgi:hypothetical protein
LAAFLAHFSFEMTKQNRGVLRHMNAGKTAARGRPRNPVIASAAAAPVSIRASKEEGMSVSRRSIVVFVALLVGLALAGPSFAKGTSVSFSLSQTAKVSNATLPPGDYKVVLDDTKATFKQGNKVIAEANGQWKKNSGKAVADAVVSNTDGRILEIHIEGRDTYFAVS